MANFDSTSPTVTLSDIWSLARSRLKLRDVLGVRGLLHLAAANEVDKAPLPRVLIELLTNYHGYLAQLGHSETGPLDSLVPNTPSLRALPPKVLAEVNMERDRLVREFERVRVDQKQRLAFLMHQVFYWLTLTDGFRVNFWAYYAIQALEAQSSIAPPLQVFRNHLRSELLSALEMAPRSAAALKSEWTKSNYEGIEELRVAIGSHGILEQDIDTFLPQFDSILRIELVHPIH